MAVIDIMRRKHPLNNSLKPGSQTSNDQGTYMLNMSF